jgi:F0F1-type ATP synthase membrane subunit b/b'
LRKIDWPNVCLLIAVAAVIGYFFIWPMFRYSDCDVEVVALIAGLDAASAEIDKAVADADSQANSDLDALAKQLDRFAQFNSEVDKLTARAREAAPQVKGDYRQQILESLVRLVGKRKLIGRQLNDVQKRIDEIAAKQPKQR